MIKRERFERGTSIDAYIIQRLIGQGGYGDIYLVKNSEVRKYYAMKVEHSSAQRTALKKEASYLKKVDGSRYFSHLVAYNELDDIRYLVMELLGPSISYLRKKVPNKKFSLSTALRLSVFMLRGIKESHKFGMVHRDIKPGNFLLRNSQEFPVVIIDLGLSKDYIDPITGFFYEEKQLSGFKGTLRYASLNSHHHQDLGRKDDLISWMYSLIEMISGKLPWHEAKELEQAQRIKEGTADILLFEGMPSSLIRIFKYINTLGFYCEPNYDLIEEALLSTVLDSGSKLNSEFDWEFLEPKDLRRASPYISLPKGSTIISLEAPKKQLIQILLELEGVAPSTCCLLL